jgi:hypothetical protein
VSILPRPIGKKLSWPPKKIPASLLAKSEGQFKKFQPVKTPLPCLAD